MDLIVKSQIHYQLKNNHPVKFSLKPLKYK